MNSGLLFFLSLLYLTVLFIVARWGENSKRLFEGKSAGFAYALSLAVYCSAWTYYGSIGRASSNGLDFLAIYLGPVVFMPIWWVLVKRMIRIVRTQHITSLSDLLASRYGKNQTIGTWVAVMIIIAITPYISLQIKAIGDSFYQLGGSDLPIWMSPVLFTTIVLCLFALVYGMRFLSGNQPKTGMITVVAFESLIKLLAFVFVAAIVIYYGFGGISNIYSQAESIGTLQPHLNMDEDQQSNWFWMLIVSGIAFTLLPRQFQMGVLENKDEKHLNTALWFLPLYMLLITVFVLPIAFGGIVLFGDNVDSDFYLLHLGTHFGGKFMGMLVYFGGFAAATSMIIVSALSLGNMLNTNVLLPALLRVERNVDMSKRITITRRISVILIFVLAYYYYYFFAFNKPLVSTGLTSFTGIAQIAPAIIGGLFWKEATRKGALAGILSGFAVWFYMLIVPTLLTTQHFGEEFLSNGAYGLTFLSPTRLADVMGMTPLSATIFISLTLNTAVFVVVSVLTTPDRLEVNQAEIFTRINRISRRTYDQAEMWKAEVPFADIKSLLINFLGDRRTEEVLDRYARINRINFEYEKNADPRMISYAERLLTESIGPASARIVIQSVAQGEELSVLEVIDILQESKEIFALNRELKAKTSELEEATEKLIRANARLQEYSDIKDEFLYTVTHELRTPLTAIRSQAELVHDDPEMPLEDRQMFMEAMVKECQRLSTLITNVLDLEKFESGSQKLTLVKGHIQNVVDNSILAVNQLIQNKHIQLSADITPTIPTCFMDVDRIQQVLINLLSNALKFVSDDGGQIKITAYVLDNSIKVNVSDNGPGVPEEDRKLIFDKFYQAKNQTKRKPKGTGLGLAICKNIIQMHKGKIWIEESSLGGTRVSFTLPLYIQKSTQN